jgi:hypothetical protein
VKEPESSLAAVGRLVSSWPATLEVDQLPAGMYVRSRLVVLGSWGRARPAEGKPARSSDVRGLGPASRPDGGLARPASRWVGAGLCGSGKGAPAVGEKGRIDCGERAPAAEGARSPVLVGSGRARG